MKWLPTWLPTLLCVAAILWLTLAPHPLGDQKLPMFPGADKIAHALMFFVFTLCVLLDTLHMRRCRRLQLPIVALISFIGMGMGVGIEYLQAAMHMGRSFEFMDMAADAFGAILAGAVWILIDNSWLRPDPTAPPKIPL
ncbi:MAG: VanZ family protein [Muribaculaceae bacterium]|nr:VanZ family protein [Muribaculaceae bacterium]